MERLLVMSGLFNIENWRVALRPTLRLLEQCFKPANIVYLWRSRGVWKISGTGAGEFDEVGGCGTVCTPSQILRTMIFRDESGVTSTSHPLGPPRCRVSVE